MSFGGGGGSGGKQTMTIEPPEWTKDYWQQLMGQAGALTSQAPTQYMGQRVADLPQQTLDSMRMTTDWATMGAPDVNAGRAQNMQTAQGAYLNANPYLSMDANNRVIADNAGNMADSFASGTAAQNSALATMQGAFGGSGYINKQASDAANLAKQVGQMANTARLGQQGLQSADWQGERARQLQGAQAGMAGQGLDLQASQALAGVGDMQRSYNQQNLDSLYQQWQQAQMAPFQNLDVMKGVLQAASGGTGGGSTQTATGAGGGWSPLAGLLGAAGIGYGLYTGK